MLVGETWIGGGCGGLVDFHDSLGDRLCVIFFRYGGFEVFVEGEESLCFLSVPGLGDGRDSLRSGPLPPTVAGHTVFERVAGGLHREDMDRVVQG